MFDSRLPADLAHFAEQKFSDGYEEVANVRDLVSKLPPADDASATGIEGPLVQLEQAKKDLLAISHKMNDAHQSFHAMQAWQDHLKSAYDRVIQEK